MKKIIIALIIFLFTFQLLACEKYIPDSNGSEKQIRKETESQGENSTTDNSNPAEKNTSTPKSSDLSDWLTYEEALEVSRKGSINLLNRCCAFIKSGDKYKRLLVGRHSSLSKNLWNACMVDISKDEPNIPLLNQGESIVFIGDYQSSCDIILVDYYAHTIGAEYSFDEYHNGVTFRNAYAATEVDTEMMYPTYYDEVNGMKASEFNETVHLIKIGNSYFIGGYEENQKIVFGKYSGTQFTETVAYANARVYAGETSRNFPVLRTKEGYSILDDSSSLLSSRTYILRYDSNSYLIAVK